MRATPTHVPEGASVSSRLLASAVRQWPQLLVLGVALLGIAVVASHHFRRGTFIVGAALLLQALLRAVLPNRRAGWLAIRGRFTDVATAGALGAALVALNFWVPAPLG